MQDFKKWYKNRWDCIDNGVEIPLLDFCFCIASLPLLAIIQILLIGTCPIWGIPFMIYKFFKTKEE